MFDLWSLQWLSAGLVFEWCTACLLSCLMFFFMGTGGARAYWLKYIKEKKLQILTNEEKVNQKKLERKIKQKTRSQIKTRKLLDVRLPSSCFMFEAGVFSIYCIFRYCILVSYL